MEIKDFYDFYSKYISSTIQVGAVGLKEFSPIESNKTYIFDEHKLIMGNYEDISFPVLFKQYDGKKLQDILDTGWVSLNLISDNMKSVLEANNLTGWKTFPVKVLDKKGEEITGYHGLSITGRCGPIDNSKAEIIEKQHFTNGPIVKFRKGLYIGLDKWDGSDFFLPEKYYGIMVTKKAADILKQSKLTNIKLENLTEVKIHL